MPASTEAVKRREAPLVKASAIISGAATQIRMCSA